MLAPIRRLLNLMACLRCISHICFLSMIAKCLELRVEHLPKKTKYFNSRKVVEMFGWNFLYLLNNPGRRASKAGSKYITH